MALKRVDELHLGDIIVEYERKKEYYYKVTSIQVAACTPRKTHVTVDGHTHWCEDSAQVWVTR